MKTKEQLTAELARLDLTNRKLNDEIDALKDTVAKLQDGREVSELRQALENSQASVEALTSQVDDAAPDIDAAQALREWFERKGVAYWDMDADTAHLWRVAKNV